MREATGTQSTGLGSAASRLRKAQGKPPPVWVHSHRVARDARRVLLFPRMPTASCGPFIPRVRGMGKATGEASPRKHCIRMGIVFPRFSRFHYGVHRVAATLYFSEHRLQTRGKRSRGDSSPGGVSREVKAEKCYAKVCTAIGSATVKAVPFPISLFTVILPS